MSNHNETLRDGIWREMGLKDDEYRLIVDRLGREPNFTELGMFAVMWSEHCGYKHSKKLLQKLPVTGPQILVGPGENLLRSNPTTILAPLNHTKVLPRV